MFECFLNDLLKYVEKIVFFIDEYMDRSSIYMYLIYWDFVCYIYFISMYFMKEGLKGVL